MESRELGRSGLEVSAVGLGCMGISEFYGASGDATSINVLHHAISIGVSFWDTADMYGTGRNEQLVGRAVFTFDDPRRIALSLAASARVSRRRKSEPFRSAMSMLNFYLNRAGRNLPAERRAILEAAKEELRALFERSRRAGR